MEINKELKKYIADNIFPQYEKNDCGHRLDHIMYVIYRSLRFASSVDDINYDMVYTIAAYHDIGHNIDAKNHEKVSSEILLADDNLKRFFTKDQIETMAQAVYDHRPSMESDPKSIYGKIVSSADRGTSVETILKRAYSYGIEHLPDFSLEERIQETKNHVINKFGKGGYATKKMYFEDKEYDDFLKKVEELLKDDEAFRNKFIKVNNIK